MSFQWIKEHREELPGQDAGLACRTLGVSRSGYYRWLKGAPGGRRERRGRIVEQIRQAHQQSRGTYGSPRVHAELIEQKVDVCLNTVARYMKELGIRAKTAGRFRVTTTDSRHPHPIAGNVLDRGFASATAPDRTWCCDITYVPTDEGWLYLAAVIDCHSRRIVGWSMADHLRAELCTDALKMALERRRPGPGLLHHSDRGVQYACRAYQAVLEEHGITCSMSRKGNCWDNALMESFFGTFKTELVYQEHYPTRAEARASVFEYIEVFYNRLRRHSAIGYQSPEAFEAGLN